MYILPPGLTLPASADGIVSTTYMPPMQRIPQAVVRCGVEDPSFGECQLPALPAHTTHRVDWDGYSARWSTNPAPVVIYPV